GLVARMESAGLVARTPDESDQRVTRVSLTDRGTEAATEARAALDDLNTALNEGFDDQELATVARWLDQAGGILTASQEHEASSPETPAPMGTDNSGPGAFTDGRG